MNVGYTIMKSLEDVVMKGKGKQLMLAYTCTVKGKL